MPYHRLDVYRKAYELSLEVHRATLGFPEFERFEIGRQLRKASTSIVANIVEGMARQKSAKDLVRFLRDAMGSCDECRLWLDYAKDLEYISEANHTDWIDRYCEVGRMTNGLIRKWQPQKAV